MGFWRIAEIIGGAVLVSYALMGFLLKQYPPMGWTTKLIWRSKNMPAWAASPFYFLLGLPLLYWGFTGE